MLKLLPIISLVLQVACTPYSGNHIASNLSVGNKGARYGKHTNGKSLLTPVNSINSSNNRCVDDFNLLRLSGSEKYQEYSHDYVRISDGYKYLNQNRNIMGSDARDVYTMGLDLKLDVLCSKVNYEGYQLIKGKIKVL
ncbi:TPA: hypothetical protein QIM62_004843 [Klebsiella aerogenes]|nr:hypothetical protein [Klebsiella aerogenes]